MAFDLRPADGALTNAIKDASSLYKLRADPPPDGDALARRAQGAARLIAERGDD